MRIAGVCMWRMWEIGSNRGLRLRWPTPNRWNKGEDDDDEYISCEILEYKLNMLSSYYQKDDYLK